MEIVREDFGELTVSETRNYGRKTDPMLRLQGLWMQELGFNVSDSVLVKCGDGKLSITFHDHSFRLYEGECLDDMVKRVQEHEILTQVIVWKNDGICE